MIKIGAKVKIIDIRPYNGLIGRVISRTQDYKSIPVFRVFTAQYGTIPFLVSNLKEIKPIKLKPFSAWK